MTNEKIDIIIKNLMIQYIAYYMEIYVQNLCANFNLMENDHLGDWSHEKAIAGD